MNQTRHPARAAATVSGAQVLISQKIRQWPAAACLRHCIPQENEALAIGVFVRRWALATRAKRPAPGIGNLRFDNRLQKAYPHLTVAMSNSNRPGPAKDEKIQPAVDLSAYRGCWVALVGGQVAGVGATAEAARLAAQSSRPRERIGAVIWVPDQS